MCIGNHIYKLNDLITELEFRMRINIIEDFSITMAAFYGSHEKRLIRLLNQCKNYQMWDINKKMADYILSKCNKEPIIHFCLCRFFKEKKREKYCFSLKDIRRNSNKVWKKEQREFNNIHKKGTCIRLISYKNRAYALCNCDARYCVIDDLKRKIKKGFLSKKTSRIINYNFKNYSNKSLREFIKDANLLMK